MGVDMLDFGFRIERRFGIKIERDEFQILNRWALERRPNLKRADLTAGELHEWVFKLCEARGMIIPHSCWHGVKLELAKTVSKPPQLIHRETFIVRELGFG